MDVATFANHVHSLPFGKKLPQATYVYAPDASVLPPELGQLVQRLRDDLVSTNLAGHGQGVASTIWRRWQSADLAPERSLCPSGRADRGTMGAAYRPRGERRTV